MSYEERKGSSSFLYLLAIIGALLVPSGLAYVLFVLGLLTYFRERWRRLSWGLRRWSRRSQSRTLS